MTKQEFIDKSKDVFNSRFLYHNITQLNLKYSDNISIFCTMCNNDINVIVGNHLSKKSVCKYCNNRVVVDNSKIINGGIIKWCGKYSYPTLDNITISNNHTEFDILCPDCNTIFKKSYKDHITAKQGCPECYQHKKMTIDIFLKKANYIHNSKYDYSLIKEIIDVDTKVEVICKKSNEIFYITPYKHINREQACTCCSRSKGEERIARFLNKNNITYESRKTIDLKHKKLFLDFYLFEGIAIEYDGEQHFKSICTFGGDSRLAKQINNDKLKDNYCIENNIKLIRIPYTEYKNIETILNEAINYRQV